jgi:hypothetical protein
MNINLEPDEADYRRECADIFMRVARELGKTPEELAEELLKKGGGGLLRPPPTR